jgi:hypothetical protein
MGVSCSVKYKIDPVVVQRVGPDCQRHSNAYVVITDIGADPSEHPERSEIHDSNGIGQIFFKSHRPVFHFLECQQGPAFLPCVKPGKIISKALAAVCPGRKKIQPAFIAAGAHDFAGIKVSHEIIHPAGGCETHGTETFETVVYLFFRHYLSP